MSAVRRQAGIRRAAATAYAKDAPLPIALDGAQLMFVYANTDRTIVFDVPRLRTMPHMYFAKLAADLRPGAPGTSQSNPLRVPLPEWFVCAFADWSMPMAPATTVFMPANRTYHEVLHYLDAIGWAMTPDAPDVHIHGLTRGTNKDERTLVQQLATIDSLNVFDPVERAVAARNVGIQRALILCKDVAATVFDLRKLFSMEPDGIIVCEKPAFDNIIALLGRYEKKDNMWIRFMGSKVQWSMTKTTASNGHVYVCIVQWTFSGL